MAEAPLDPYRLSSPRIYLVRMLVFLALAGFLALILYRPIAAAFMANPGLNGLILGVLLIGVALALRQVAQLFPETRWVNSHGTSRAAGAETPPRLAALAAMLGAKEGRGISTLMLRAILDSVATRLDEAHDTGRYLTGLLIFLGLLGTFWGLIETVGSIGGVIKSMQTGADAAVMFDELKNGLAAPLAGMSISFTSSLFGLAGSLVLGFLDLQANQAQTRFYQELEDNLSARIAETGEARPAADAQTPLIADLAEGVHGLVARMRDEQRMIREWAEAQSLQQAELKRAIDRLTADLERR